MKTFEFEYPKFIKTAVEAKDFPILKQDNGKIFPEIAVAGRSNVGKSSLLNHLFQTKNLVKTSSVPGKTQALNFFSVDNSLSIVDLPGYGFAKVPHSVKQLWGPMIDTYLQQRETLKLVLLLLDIRRTPTEDDKIFLDWAAKSNKSLILILTKIDKVNQSELYHNTKNILSELNSMNLHYLHYTVTKSKPRDLLIRLINDALKDELSN